MSDLESSSTCEAALRFCTSCSYKRARSIFIAVSLLACWERSFWQQTTVLLGTWVIRTAESVVLTCWPPAPEEREVSLRRPDGMLLISMLLSISGEKTNASHEVG